MRRTRRALVTAVMAAAATAAMQIPAHATVTVYYNDYHFYSYSGANDKFHVRLIYDSTPNTVNGDAQYSYPSGQMYTYQGWDGELFMYYIDGNGIPHEYSNRACSITSSTPNCYLTGPLGNPSGVQSYTTRFDNYYTGYLYDSPTINI